MYQNSSLLQFNIQTLIQILDFFYSRVRARDASVHCMKLDIKLLICREFISPVFTIIFFII